MDDAKRDVSAWLITFGTYGSRLPGDPRGSYDHKRRPYQEQHLAPNDRLWAHGLALQDQAPIALDLHARSLVAEAIREVCRCRGWYLHALNVRTEHLHAVAEGDGRADRIMCDFKAYATRHLIAGGVYAAGMKIWARHGSLRRIYSEAQLARACQYVERQDQPRTADPDYSEPILDSGRGNVRLK